MLEFKYDDGGRRKYFKALTGDCVVRSIAIATGIDYKEVYGEMARRFKAAGYAKTGNADAVGNDGSGRGWDIQQGTLRAFGFAPSTQVLRGRRSVESAWDEYGYQHGKCIVITRRHALAVVDGVVHDTWDSRQTRGGKPMGAHEVWIWADPKAWKGPVKTAPTKRQTPTQRRDDNYAMLDHIEFHGWGGEVGSSREAYVCGEGWTDRRNDTVLYRLLQLKFLDRRKDVWTGRILALQITQEGYDFMKEYRKEKGIVTDW